MQAREHLGKPHTCPPAPVPPCPHLRARSLRGLTGSARSGHPGSQRRHTRVLVCHEGASCCAGSWPPARARVQTEPIKWPRSHNSIYNTQEKRAETFPQCLLLRRLLFGKLECTQYYFCIPREGFYCVSLRVPICAKEGLPSTRSLAAACSSPNALLRRFGCLCLHVPVSVACLCL